MSRPAAAARRGVRRSARLALAGVLAALAGMPATAAAEQLPLWELGVGVAALSLPNYRGSAQVNRWLLPLPFAVYRGEILRADREGARALLFESDRIDLDISLFATPPTRSGDDDARSGMPDLAATVEIGPNLQFALGRGADWKLDLRLPVRAAVTLQSRPQAIGWVATPNLNLDLRHGAWNLGALTGPVFGTSRFFGYFYDVSDAQATPARPAYQSSGGYGGWQATLSASRRFDAHWLGLFVRFDTVSGAGFADSPLVQQAHNLAFGIAWSWSLVQSAKRVSERGP
jgi:outer membrane scaffolding protein for murein synthesis (MipA/OmpV family)